LHQLPPIFRTNLIPNPRPGDGRVLNSRQQPRSANSWGTAQKSRVAREANRARHPWRVPI
jgi:hypothetical protein